MDKITVFDERLGGAGVTLNPQQYSRAKGTAILTHIYIYILFTVSLINPDLPGT